MLLAQKDSAVPLLKSEVAPPPSVRALTRLQELMLLGDWFHHANNEVSFQYISFGIALTQLLNLPIAALAVWQLASYVIGLLSAKADYRTCRKAVEDANVNISEKLFSADRRSIRNAVITGTASIIGIPIAASSTIDDMLQVIYSLWGAPFERSFYGRSMPGLIIGVCLGLLSAFGATYCHLKLNINSQHPEESEIQDEKQHAQFSPASYDQLQKSMQLSNGQHFLLLADRLNHGNSEVAFQYIAGGNILLAFLGAPVYAFLLWQLASYALGWYSSSADYRTCSNSVKTWNKHCFFHKNSKNMAPDRYTIMNAVIIGLAAIIATPFDTAETFDDTFDTIGSLAGNPLNRNIQGVYSLPGLLLGCAVGIWCTLGATYAHLILNTNNQQPAQSNPVVGIDYTPPSLEMVAATLQP